MLPFQGRSDLQVGDEEVTLNHLEYEALISLGLAPATSEKKMGPKESDEEKQQ